MTGRDGTTSGEMVRFKRGRVKRCFAGATATVVSAALLSAGAAAPAALAATRPASAPLVPLAHKHLLDARVKAAAAASFRVLGAAGVPAAGVSAVVVSVAVASATSGGALVAFPAGAKRPHVVSVTLVKGHAAAARAVLVPGKLGKADLYNGTATTQRLVVTVLGYYAAPGTAQASNATSAFVALSAKRLGSVVVKASGAAAVTALGKVGIPTSEVDGVVVALTVAAPTSNGALVAYPYGSKAPKQSSLSFHAGRAVTAVVIVQPGVQGRIVVADRSTKPVRVFLDVVGYLHELTVPGVAGSVTASARSGAAAVSWAAPSSDGGTPVTSYRVVAQPGGASVTVAAPTTSVTVGGLVPHTPYTFTVVAVNARGSSVTSAPSGAVTPFTVPAAPAAPSAVSTAAGQATVAWSGPADDGGSAVTGYQVTAQPGGATATSATSSVTMSGLTGGAYYTFTVVAVNVAGPSPASVPSAAALVEGISRVSSSPAGDPGNGDSQAAAVSQHGRFVAFQSRATNLAGQASVKQQVYLRDRQTGVTSLVSVAMNGAPGNGDSTAPSISADGRYVVFSSNASDLVAGDGNGFSDVFVRDTQLGATRLLSAVNGVPANQYSYQGVISADGTTVAFTSYATDLAAVATGGHANIYVVPLATGVATLVSETAAHGAATHDSGEPAISGDGAVVAFESNDPALQTAVSIGLNQFEQVYVRAAGSTTLLSTAAGVPGDFNSENPSVSSDGTYVAFDTTADNLITGGNPSSAILVGDTATQVLTLAAGGTSTSSGEHPSISLDGTQVAYDSTVPLTRSITFQPGGHVQIFRAQWQQGTTLLVSSAAGVAGNGTSGYPALSGDGQHVAFQSLSSNLTPGVTNPSIQVLDADLG
jgi:Tol biopolymer transport system component